MIKAVIFDCFGVLTTDKWKEFVATLPPSQQQAARDANHAYDQAKISKTEFISQIKDLTGREPGGIADTQESEGPKNNELLSYIKTLKTKYKTAILSNIANNWIQDELLTPDEVKLFDAMILSFEVKMTKPDPRIFRLASEKLDVETTECIFIDDIETYCQAARTEGMQAVVYQNFEQMKQELENLLAKA